MVSRFKYVGRRTLEYRSPEALKRQARIDDLPDIAKVDPWVLERYVKDGFKRVPFSASDTDAEIRNLLVWFLIAAGVRTSEVGTMFELSDSRCRQIATRAAHQHLSGMCTRPRSAVVRKLYEKGMSPIERKIGAMQYRQEQMMAAEFLLHWYGHSAMILKCLDIGRKSFSAAYAQVAGFRCGCRVCAGVTEKARPYHGVWIYWDESQV